MIIAERDGQKILIFEDLNEFRECLQGLSRKTVTAIKNIIARQISNLETNREDLITRIQGADEKTVDMAMDVLEAWLEEERDLKPMLKIAKRIEREKV